MHPICSQDEWTDDEMCVFAYRAMNKCVFAFVMPFNILQSVNLKYNRRTQKPRNTEEKEEDTHNKNVI